MNTILKYFSGEAFVFFIIPYVLVLFIGLAFLKAKKYPIQYSSIFWVVLTGFMLGVFVSFLEGFKEGARFRALSMGVATSMIFSALIFGVKIVLPEQIANAIVKFYGGVLIDGTKDNLPKGK